LAPAAIDAWYARYFRTIFALQEPMIAPNLAQIDRSLIKDRDPCEEGYRSHKSS
jgi:hypothetical protein